MGFLNGNKSLEELEMEKERVKAQVEVEQNKALIAEAKKRYGSDWKDKVGSFLKNSKSGIDWNAVKFRMQK